MLYNPIACRRPGPSHSRWMSEKTCGISRAAPIAWAIRAATSMVTSIATPHTKEATVNQTSPDKKVRRWPSTSPIRAQVTNRTQVVSR